MADEKIVSKVLSRLSGLRQDMSPDEQKVLDRLVSREEDEVSAHALTAAVQSAANLKISYSVKDACYKIIS